MPGARYSGPRRYPIQKTTRPGTNAAVLASQDVQGWIIGLVVSTISVVLAAVLWSARAL